MAFFQSQPPREPFLHAPGSVIWLLVVLVGVHVSAKMGWMAPGWAEWMVLLPDRLSHGFSLPAVVPLFTYMFFQVDTGNLLLQCIWVLVFGTPIAKRFGAFGLFGIFISSGLIAAGAYIALHWGAQAAAFGCSGALAGMLGAGIRLVVWPGQKEEVRLTPLTAPTILALSALWVAANVFLGLSTGDEPFSVGWLPRVVTYFYGLLSVSLIDRLARRG